MQLIKWVDEFSVGIEVIDSHHKKIVQYINELHDSLLSKQSITTTGNVLRNLVDYAKYHLGFEEDLFEKFNYEEADSHIEQHILFINKLTELIEKYEDNNVFIAQKTINFLKDWLINHIIKVDKKYIKCFIEHG